MAPSKAKYQQIPDLYSTGTELVLADGTVMYLRIMNPFEREEAMRDGQVARARFTLAIGDEQSEEFGTVRGMYQLDGRDQAVAILLEAKRADAFVQILDELRVDEDWREKSEIVLRADNLAAPSSQTEMDYAEKCEKEFREELTRRVLASQEFERTALEACSDDELWDEYKQWWLETNGAERGMVEYRLTEMMYACRACDGVRTPDGWDHSACDGHKVRVFDSKHEIKHLPLALQELLRDTLAGIDMGERAAKNSDRQGNSSESSPLPSAPEDSTSSTQEQTSATVPGRLPQLSATR